MKFEYFKNCISLCLKKNSKHLYSAGLSDNFANDEKCMQVYELVKNIIKANYLIVEFGSSHKWIELPALAAVCSDVRVIMQDPQRFKVKINEILESIDRQIVDVVVDRAMAAAPPDVFISYCWKNSHDAIKKGSNTTKTGLGWFDPREMIKLFEDNGKFKIFLKYDFVNLNK